MVIAGTRSGAESGRAAARRLAVPALLAFWLAGCASTSITGDSQLALPATPKQAEMAPATQREHQRILVAYGGAYESPKLEALLAQTVDKLVAASERPDLKYQVTILNSPAINAFALPTGQLYVTRGLIALANDNSELASVLSHEMAHVIARHAAIREDQARQAALVSRVANDLLSDRKPRRARAGEIQDRAGELLARAGVRGRRHRRRHLRARRLRSLRRTALPHLDGAATRNSAPAPPTSIRARRISCRRIRRRRNASATRRSTRASTPARAPANATAANISRQSTAWCIGEDPSEGFVRGRRFLHPKLGFTFTAPDGFSLDNTRTGGVRREGGRRAGVAPRCGARAARAVAHRISGVGLDREHRRQKRPGDHPQRRSGGNRDRRRRQLDVPAVRRALRQRRLSLHLRRQAAHRSGRPHLPRFDQQLPPHDRHRAGRGQAAAHPGREGRQRATRSTGWRSAWRFPIVTPNASACSTGSPPTTGSSPAIRSRSWWNRPALPP